MSKNLKILALFLLFAVLISGCTQTIIKEDAVREPLPGIDPSAGVGRDVSVTLYFRLTEEPALVPVQRIVTVRANEYIEAAVIRQLLAGPAALYGDLESVVPKGTRLVEVAREGGILYVTLSNEMLSYTGKSSLHEEIELAHRLSVYAIVNTLCALGGSSRVQLLIDIDGKGAGARVPPFALGFTSAHTSSKWLEPMSENASVIITPNMLIELALGHLAEGEYAQAYSLFAESEIGGFQKPDFAAFETQLLSIGTIEAFTVRNSEINSERIASEAYIDITWTGRKDRQEHKAVNAAIQLLQEGELYKLGYYSLLNVLLAG